MNHHYIIYKVATGEIVQSCQAPDIEGVRFIAKADEEVLEVAERQSNSKVYVQAAGSVVPPLAPALLTIPPQPSPAHVFDFTTKTWGDPRTLAQLKDARWSTVKTARAAAESAGFTWSGSTFDSDPISQSRIQGAVLLAGMAPDFTITWTLADNTTRLLDAAGMVGVGAALGVHVGTQFEIARQLREAIYAATTPAAIAAIAWPT